ncbi:substrate-binding domain-containing protein [Streptomyces sp. R35]|uniref:Substrate-binding domain-containing protein n=1 Tax=Streptomyces sp. R35 TaxID=3238630 RepID=A0AB39SPG4_9ACTN
MGGLRPRLGPRLLLGHLTESGARRIGLFLPLHDDAYPRLIAVIGVYSDSGHNILAAARHHGLRVPRDLLVACVSEDPDCATTNPPVTTVSLRPDLVGTEAVDLLIAVVNARSGVHRRRLVQPVLLPRRSTRRAVRRSNGTP